MLYVLNATGSSSCGKGEFSAETLGEELGWVMSIPGMQEIAGVISRHHDIRGSIIQGGGSLRLIICFGNDSKNCVILKLEKTGEIPSDVLEKVRSEVAKRSS